MSQSARTVTSGSVDLLDCQTLKMLTAASVPVEADDDGHMAPEVLDEVT
jgi:hypothetical protein